MKKAIYLLMLLTAVSLFSCQEENISQEKETPKEDTPKEDTIITPNVNITIEGTTSTENLTLPQEDSVLLKIIVDNTTDYTVTWNLNGQEVSKQIDYSFIATNLGEHRIEAVVLNHDGGKSQAEIKINVYGKYKHGTFVLNEGNMTTENGSLIFINPQGIVTDSAYWRVNKTFLGNTTQDLYISEGKLYIISQNGNKNAVGSNFANDGMLVIANAETLKKESSYDSELSSLSWPTHIAVIGDNAYIRDNKGIQLFNLRTKTLAFITGSKGAMKNSMAVVRDKVFVPAGKKIFVIKGDTIIHTIDMPGTISGVIKTSDNNIYVSCNTTPAQIYKISATNYFPLQSNQITETKVGAGVAATPGITAKGDTIYFSNMTTKIYRHIFSQNKTEYMTNVKDHIDNAGIVYNTPAVHPVTGELYFNTIKGFGWDFLINNITVFNFSAQNPILKENYQNHTHFPAGIFFTDNF